jgi:hypothetical protein
MSAFHSLALSVQKETGVLLQKELAEFFGIVSTM